MTDEVGFVSVGTEVSVGAEVSVGDAEVSTVTVVSSVSEVGSVSGTAVVSSVVIVVDEAAVLNEDVEVVVVSGNVNEETVLVSAAEVSKSIFSGSVGNCAGNRYNINAITAAEPINIIGRKLILLARRAFLTAAVLE